MAEMQHGQNGAAKSDTYTLKCTFLTGSRLTTNVQKELLIICCFVIVCEETSDTFHYGLY